MHPQTTPDKPLDSIDFPKQDDWAVSTKVVAAFHHEPLFIETLHDKGIDTNDPASYDYQLELASYGDSYCHAHTDILSQDEMARIQLLSYAPSAMTNQGEAEYYAQEKEHRWLTDEEWTYLENVKTFTVWYNQLLSDYMYDHPDSSFSTISKSLTEASLAHFTGHETALATRIKSVAKGARTESVARQLLDSINEKGGNLPYDRATVEEDLQGADVIILHKNNRVKIDFKSSLDQIASARGGYDQADTQKMYAVVRHKDPKTKKTKFSKIVLFPPINDTILKDNCFMPAELKTKAASVFEEQVKMALREARM